MTRESRQKFPPRVGTAGADRSVVTGGKTYLAGKMRSVGAEGGVAARSTWGKDSGPGDVVFADASAPVTTAICRDAGRLCAEADGDAGRHELGGHVEGECGANRRRRTGSTWSTRRITEINNPFWNSRVKALMVNWILHCIDEINSTNIPQNEGAGGLTNFIEAAKALKRPAARAAEGLCVRERVGFTRRWRR